MAESFLVIFYIILLEERNNKRFLNLRNKGENKWKV